MITHTQAQALLIVKHHPGATAKIFSLYMWPGEKKSSLAAGGMLGKLVKAGLLRRDVADNTRHGGGYYITESGENALQEFGEEL